MHSYDFHDVTQRAARLPSRYQPVSAPWYEVEFTSTGVGAGWRLLVHEAQWRLSSLADTAAAAVVEGVDVVISIVPVAAYWDTAPATLNGTILNYHYVNHTLTEALLNRMQCSFTADERGSDAGVGETIKRVRTAAALITSASALRVTFTANPFLVGTTHHIVHCPFPRLPAHVQSLLIRPNSSVIDEPRLQLSSISLHLDMSTSSAFGLSVLRLPLCLLRHRRVTAALVLSTQLGPPHLLRPRRLHAFLSYYMFLGVQLFIVPERFGPLLHALQPQIDMGAVWYVRQPFQSAYHQPYLDQMPVLHSCVLRVQYAAEWVFSMDVDEYVSFDHPYWTEGAGVQPPSDGCWLSDGGRAVDGDSVGSGCRSLLSAWLSQPGFEHLSLISLANVPHWGLAQPVNKSLLSLSSSPSAATAYIHSLHPLDVWTRRCYGAEKYRYKLLFRPTHVSTVTMHEATLRADCCESPDGVGGGVVDAWEKYWGDAGLQEHRDTVLRDALTETAGMDLAALIQQEQDKAEVHKDENGELIIHIRVPELSVQHEAVRWHPSLQLLDVLCGAEMRERTDVQLSFNLRCCDVAYANNSCFVHGAAHFSPYLLATLTPLFPTVAQSNTFSPSHPTSPRPIPDWARPLPLALFGSHVSHLICSHMAAVDLPHCTAANRTLTMEPMWGESQRAGIAFDAEHGDERSKVLLRATLKQWLAQQHWAPQWQTVEIVDEAPITTVGSEDL